MEEVYIHICPLRDHAGALMEPGCTSLVMEFVPFGNLFQNIQNDMSHQVQWWQRGKQIALDIARGLVFLHSRKVRSLFVCCGDCIGILIVLGCGRCPLLRGTVQLSGETELWIVCWWGSQVATWAGYGCGQHYLHVWHVVIR